MIPQKAGRGFFITLLAASGITIFLLYAFFFRGKEITIFMFKWFVVNRAFVQRLPSEYTLEKTEAVRKQVHDFYERATYGEIGDTAVMQVSQKIQQIMADEKITDAEVVSLRALIEGGA